MGSGVPRHTSHVGSSVRTHAGSFDAAHALYVASHVVHAAEHVVWMHASSALKSVADGFGVSACLWPQVHHPAHGPGVIAASDTAWRWAGAVKRRCTDVGVIALATSRAGCASGCGLTEEHATKASMDENMGVCLRIIMVVLTPDPSLMRGRQSASRLMSPRSLNRARASRRSLPRR